MIRDALGILLLHLLVGLLRVAPEVAMRWPVSLILHDRCPFASYLRWYGVI